MGEADSSKAADAAREKLSGPPAASSAKAAASNNSSDATANDAEPNLQPFYALMLCVLAGAYQFVSSRVAYLQDAERNWDPSPKGMAENEVIVMYCSGCAYEGTYRQVHQLLMERAVRNDIQVRGVAYPTPPSKQFLGNMLQYVQLAIFAFIFFGESVWKAVFNRTNAKGEDTTPPAPWFVKMFCDNKMGSFMMVWLMGNVLASTILNSGAFEIFYQDQTVWSSLANDKRMPQYYDILNGCKRAGLELMSSTSGR